MPADELFSGAPEPAGQTPRRAVAFSMRCRRRPRRGRVRRQVHEELQPHAAALEPPRSAQHYNFRNARSATKAATASVIAGMRAGLDIARYPANAAPITAIAMDVRSLLDT